MLILRGSGRRARSTVSRSRHPAICPDASRVQQVPEKKPLKHYKVDTDAIAKRVNEEFTAKQKAQAARKEGAKAKPKQPRSKGRLTLHFIIPNGVCFGRLHFFCPFSHP
jgi:hypothetical protein